jgi:hypothetical protein
MREIKFRGIASCDVEYTDVKEGNFIFGQVVFDEGKPYIVGPVIDSDSEYIALEHWCPVRPETLGQFTGESDENGKEVFEGDIMEADFALLGKFQAPVKYIKHAFWIELPDSTLHWPNKFTVIGNIHQYSDLLQSEPKGQLRRKPDEH